MCKAEEAEVLSSKTVSSIIFQVDAWEFNIFAK